MPERLEIPEKLVYRYMIHTLAKFYRISPALSSRLKEIDFWQMRMFDELDIARTDYFLKLKNDK